MRDEMSQTEDKRCMASPVRGTETAEEGGGCQGLGKWAGDSQRAERVSRASWGLGAAVQHDAHS